MAEKKKMWKVCPLLAAGTLACSQYTTLRSALQDAQCLKENCVFWDITAKDCKLVSSLQTIANDIYELTETLRVIADKVREK